MPHADEIDGNASGNGALPDAALLQVPALRLGRG